MALFIKLFSWFGRITAMLLFLLWGAFFVEHLTEWFKDAGHLPPWSVFLIQFFHLLMLVGYIAVFKWKILGSSLIILGAFIFFVSLGAKAMLAFFAISIIPAVIFLFVFYFEKKFLSAQSVVTVEQMKE